jgi:CelD/BcsL family acetyltransferase involved in cellulose biosynthesis
MYTRAQQSIAAAGGYTVAVNGALDDRAALELWDRAQTAVVFNHPAWWRAAVDAFGEQRPLKVLSVWQGGQLIALWPQWVKRLGAREAFARVVEPIGARVTDYCIPLLARGHDPAVLLDLLMRRATALLDVQTLLLWPKVPMTPELGAPITQAAQTYGGLCKTYERPCAAMSLPERYDDLEKRWSKSHRGDLRRQTRRLGAAGRLELIQMTDRAQIRAMLPRLYAMHTANWRSRTGFSELESSPMTVFVARLADTLPVQLMDASEVRLDGVAIASHFGFRHERTILWYKPTFDVAWANYAPGKVHIALAAKAAIEAGVVKIDFMQGTEPYKLLWSDLTTVTKSFAIARPIAYPIWAWNTFVRRFAAEYRN